MTALSPAADVTRRSPAAGIAVAICTAGRPAALATTLASIWGQSRRPDELILVDDGRLDRVMLDGIAARCEHHDIRFIYHRKDAPGLTASRNIAARLATGDVIVYLDDDVTCAADFLAQVERIMADPAVGGIRPDVREPAWTGLSARIYQAGYRLAGWWRIRPRIVPPAPPPAIVHDRSGVRATTLLSGAAMALRRDLVIAHPFDESLTRYALGEDREMAWRLSRVAWLVEVPQARVVHRRDAAGRTDPRRFGFMTTCNYLYILRRHCRLGPGDYLLLAWTFMVLAAMHLLYLAGRNRRAHAAELRGMAEGLLAALRARPPAPAVSRCHKQPVSVVRSGFTARHVLLVTNRLEHGGAEWMLLSLATELPRHGIEPAVLCLKDAGPLAVDARAADIPVFERFLRHKYDLLAISRIVALLDSAAFQRFDAVVAVGSGGDRMFWSTLAGRAAGVPVVVWSHWCPTPAELRFERANRALYRSVDRFVAVGRRHADALARIEFVPRGRITVIHNGIDLARFDQRHRRAEARAALGLRDDEIAIAIVANLRREKRHDVFIEGARRLAPHHPSARFFVIGDGPHRDAVRDAADRSGLTRPALQLLGSRDDMPLLYAGLDICCLASELECFSITMLEAAAAGCAFVGPDSGSNDEFLEDGVTGLVTRPADAASLATALDRLIRDPTLRQTLAQNARARVRAEFGIERTAEQFARLFHSLVARPAV